MKNSTAPNRKTGRMIAKNLIVLFTVALAGFCGIQAWFTDKSSADADGINVECQAPDGIEIAVVKHKDPAPTAYTTGKITLDKDNYPFLEKLQLTEITGDGTYFKKPALIQSGGQAQVDPDAEWSDPTANLHYLSFDLYIRSKSQYNIAIGKNSTIKPVAPQLKTQDGTGIQNESKYGKFSRDSVVGAVRFSVVDYDSQPTPSKKLLWLPAPNILLTQDGDGYTLSDNMRSGVSYSHVYYDTNKAKQTVSSTTGDDAFVVNNNGFPDGKFTYELGENKEIARLEKPSGSGQENNQFFSAMVTCNMWIEGEDKEARLALVNGKFKVNLVLTKEVLTKES